MSADANTILIQTLITNVSTLLGKIDALVCELHRVAVAVGRLEERMNAADAASKLASETAERDACKSPNACLSLQDRINDHEDRLKPLEQRQIEDHAIVRARERVQRWVTIGLSTATALAGAVIGATVPTLLQRFLGP